MDYLKKHIDDFLKHITIEKNYSETTELSYRIALHIFFLFLQESAEEFSSSQCINNYIKFLKARNNTDTTIAHRLAVLKSFFTYLINKKNINKKRLPQINKFKTTQKIINIPSDDEVKIFLNTIENDYKKFKKEFEILKNPNHRMKSKYFSLYRNLTFFSLLTASGLRISEALNIKIDDINYNDYSIIITGKGRKERIIYFGIDKLKKLINNLLLIKKDFALESPYLFFGYQHKNKLTPRYIQMTMKNYINKLSLKNYTPHTLRHYYATRSIENGANIKAVSMLLGHANIQTTLKMYFHISKKILREVFETLNPFNNITLTVGQMIENRYALVGNL